jgi:hypothetical protein
MEIQAGMKVTNKEGLQGVVLKSGYDSSKVLSLASGEMRKWPLNSYTANDKQDIGSVFVVNPATFKISTIMWGVFFGNLLTGIVGAVAYAVTR